jgi:hypothetical protein
MRLMRAQRAALAFPAAAAVSNLARRDGETRPHPDQRDSSALPSGAGGWFASAGAGAGCAPGDVSRIASGPGATSPRWGSKGRSPSGSPRAARFYLSSRITVHGKGEFDAR